MNDSRHAAVRWVPFLVGSLLTVLSVLIPTALLVFLTARRVVVPKPRSRDVRIIGIDSKAQTISMVRNAETELPGRYGLITTGDQEYIKIGTVLDRDARSVKRKLLTQVAAHDKIADTATLNGWYYTQPDELHLPWEGIDIESDIGTCPAWHFPSKTPGSVTSRICVIHIHGRGAERAECLRAVPIFHALGLASLVVSYRNDQDAPRSTHGAYGLGSSEWHDVEPAIAWAKKAGYRSIVLMGWSMGGAIAMQLALSSTNRENIVGLILESPVVDWRSTLTFQAQQERIAAPIARGAVAALESSLTARLAGADSAIPFRRLDIVSRAEELDTPLLILHSDADSVVPAGPSRILAEARPDLITMPEVTQARHTRLWNYDSAGWSQTITEWMRTAILH